ncbi:MAG: winged helix-turn-helix domain-containing protein [Thermoleophilia bacterium]
MRKKPGRLEIRSKIWIEAGGKPVFSKGREMLFKAIEKHGSINMAAREMGIPYRRAWGYIKAMEERTGLALVETRKGGVNGGGARLTEAAAELLAKFERLERGVDRIVDKRFDELFKGGGKK